MDKHFMAIALIGVIVLGALGVILGTTLILVTKDLQAGAVCLGLGSTALGALGGILAAPKLLPPTV